MKKYSQNGIWVYNGKLWSPHTARAELQFARTVTHIANEYFFTKMQGDKSKQNQKYHTCAWASSTVHVRVHVVFEDLPYVLVHFGSSGFCDILMLRLSSFLSPPSHSFLGFTSSACPRSCYMSALSSHPLTEYPLRGFKSPSEIRHLIWMRGEPAWITDPSIQQVEIIR